MWKYLVFHYIVDLWTIAHAVGWAIIAAAFARADRGLALGWIGPRAARVVVLPAGPTAVIGALVLGLAWEIVEMLVVEPLLGFREPLANRFLADPAANVIGAAIGAALTTWRARADRNASYSMR